MKRWQRRLLIFAGVLITIGVPAYWWLTVESSVPDGRFEIELAQVRKLANEIPGEKANAIHVEAVSRITFPRRAIVAGESWSGGALIGYAYQLTFPDGHQGMIDTGWDSKTAKDGAADEFYSAGWERVVAAMHSADWIVVTHEHSDHLGGLAVQPDLKSLFGKMKITTEQLRPASRVAGAEFSPGALDGYQPLDCGKYCAVAPGVVLIKSPGHTPGAQMVFVQLADGAEFLFLGDVAWWMANVERIRERARLATLLMKEDRDAVLLQLQELNRLMKEEPSLQLIAGHDREQVDALIASKRLVREFIPKPN